MLCVLYHLTPYQEDVIKSFKTNLPNHKFIVLQGNLPRVKKKNQVEAGVPGMINILQKNSYNVPQHNIYEWSGYQKPVVIGERNLT